VLAAVCSPGSTGGGTGGIKRISIATGGTGGVYYPYGGGIAKVISENIPGVEATAEATAASVDNLKFIRDGRSDVAFSMADTVEDAALAKGPFSDSPKVPVRTLAVLYSNYLHLATLTTTGISTVADLSRSSRPAHRAAGRKWWPFARSKPSVSIQKKICRRSRSARLSRLMR
jgi:TRAP transporter TAXI family solute receptor